MREYDIIAIGGGSGGIATMNRAGEHWLLKRQLLRKRN